MWFMRVHAPGGDVEAVAESFDWVGPGANAVETNIRLERYGNPQEAVYVTGVADARSDGLFAFQWLTPKRLRIIVKCPRTVIDHYEKKALGVDISVQHGARGYRC